MNYVALVAGVAVMWAGPLLDVPYHSLTGKMIRVASIVLWSAGTLGLIREL